MSEIFSIIFCGVLVWNFIKLQRFFDNYCAELPGVFMIQLKIGILIVAAVNIYTAVLLASGNFMKVNAFVNSTPYWLLLMWFVSLLAWWIFFLDGAETIENSGEFYTQNGKEVSTFEIKVTTAIVWMVFFVTGIMIIFGGMEIPIHGMRMGRHI